MELIISFLCQNLEIAVVKCKEVGVIVSGFRIKLNRDSHINKHCPKMERQKRLPNKQNIPCNYKPFPFYSVGPEASILLSLEMFPEKIK